MKTAKQIRRFRVKVGDNYCSLNHDFHELGVCIPDSSQSSAHVFKNLNGAQNAISRTIEAKKKINESLTPDFKGFAPLKFAGTPEPEEFWV